jgi:hypothetical protein
MIQQLYRQSHVRVNGMFTSYPCDEAGNRGYFGVSEIES